MMDERKTYDPQDVRQGEIILRHRWSRFIFIAALAGLVVAALLIRVGLSV